MVASPLPNKGGTTSSLLPSSTMRRRRPMATSSLLLRATDNRRHLSSTALRRSSPTVPHLPSPMAPRRRLNHTAHHRPVLRQANTTLRHSKELTPHPRRLSSHMVGSQDMGNPPLSNRTASHRMAASKRTDSPRPSNTRRTDSISHRPLPRPGTVPRRSSRGTATRTRAGCGRP
jgi:hypothetical protein